MGAFCFFLANEKRTGHFRLTSAGTTGPRKPWHGPPLAGGVGKVGFCTGIFFPMSGNIKHMIKARLFEAQIF
jgi:hypothetical protein